MKRLIAFLLVVVMCIGLIPASLLPVLAHGVGVGVDNVENLSIDNAPNQKIPATVQLDGKSNDTAWPSDEWEIANEHTAIWNTVSDSNPDFEYRYQLHTDYEFLYGVVEFEAAKASQLGNITVWINDGTAENNYTVKIVITPADGSYGIKLWRYSSTGAVEVNESPFVQYEYEKAMVVSGTDSGVVTLEFKALIFSVLGKVIDQKTAVNLTAFVSAQFGDNYLYHPRVDAEQDAKSIDLSKTWNDGANEITQTMIYDTEANPETANKLSVDAVDYITVDGHLSEEAWADFTNYGGSGFETFKEYEIFTDHGHKIANYEVEYSTEYMYHDGQFEKYYDDNKVLQTSTTDYADKWVHYHNNNVNYQYDKYGTTGKIKFTEGCIDGHIFTGVTPWKDKDGKAVGPEKEHYCDRQCEENYINNVPTKFKYQIKSDGKNVYGAVVLSQSIYDERFYYDISNGLNTYFKVMIAGKAGTVEGSQWSRYAQLELQHNLENRSIHSFQSSSANTRVITANSQLGKNDKKDANGNTILPDGIGAYARRLDAYTMVFEFCISYEQLNANIAGPGSKSFKFEPGKEMSVILSVGNETSSVGYAGPANIATSARGVHAASASYFSHIGMYDVLGRENRHIYTLASEAEQTKSPEFNKNKANGDLDAGVFNGLIARDLYINSAYRGVVDSATTNTGIEVTLGGIQYMDYDIFMSTEYLYGAAIIHKDGYEAAGDTTKNKTIDSNDQMRLWINNGTPQWRDRYDYVLNFYLNPSLQQITLGAADGAVTAGNKTSYISGGTMYNGIAMEKGSESIALQSKALTLTKNGTSNYGVSYNVHYLDDAEYEDSYSTSSKYRGTPDTGETVVLEFKIPLELLGITEKYTENTDGSTKETAFTYFVSGESIGDGSEGIVAPIPDNAHYRRSQEQSGSGKLPENYYAPYRKLSLTITDNGNHGGWIATSYDGVDGAAHVKTQHRTNQFVIDGILDEVIWNDEDERIWVNSTTGSWGNEPDVPHMFDYYTAVYAGREYIYGSALINTVAEDKEELDFTLWIRQNQKAGTNKSTKADKKFRIVQKGDGAVCYDLNGNELALTHCEDVWEAKHESTYTLEYTDGKVAMTHANGVTYVEFMFSLEGMGITLHEQGEDKWVQFQSKGVDNTGSSLAASDKFYYYPNGTYFAENKKLGFEYFVSVTKTDTECKHTNTLYYPSPKTTAVSGITDKDKYCHLADKTDYNSKDRWDAPNAYTIEPLDYFLPETITIDGDLSDNGWREGLWVDVKEGVNGNLQNRIEDMLGATVAEYKYQTRIDDEYLYVAAVLDTAASPVYFKIDGKVFYSVPKVRLWLQSKDKDYAVTVNTNGLQIRSSDENASTQHTFTYEDAISFTHLYDVELGYSSTTGQVASQDLAISEKATQYVPETYVTWQDNNVPHVTADKLTALDDSLNPETLTITGTTLRYAAHHTGFFAPHGGNPRGTYDRLGILSYKVHGVNDDFVDNVVDNTYPTNFNYYNYDATKFYGETKVIEENTVTAKGENEYTDKDWYAKPEVKKYVYGNEHAVMTSDETGKATVVEFRVPLADFGCEDGDDFEYFMQGGTTGIRTDTAYTLFNPPISYGFSKTTPADAGKVSGRPFWYWATTGKLVDKAERERIRLRNNYEPVTPIGTQYKENYTYPGYSQTFLGIKFGVLYNADYMRQPANTDPDSVYKNATYWDLKEIGMMIGYTDYLKGDANNLTSESADDYNIFRVESDAILNHVSGTNMADYESYIFYATKLLWQGEEDLKLTYRGFIDYYPSDHIYYTMADKVFSKDYPWTYSTPESEGAYYGKPLAMEGVNNDPTKIPKTYTYRPTFYSDPVTRNINMIKYADDSIREVLPGQREDIGIGEVIKPDSNGTKILYVPIDNRPINLERVQYQAEAAGFEIVLPPEEYFFSTNVDTYKEGKSDQGNPRDLYTWLETEYAKNEYRYYIISLDQLFSGGLVGSREPFYDEGDSIANFTGIKDGTYTGYTLSNEENAMMTLVKKIVNNDSVNVIFFDTIKRLASTQDYFAMEYSNYNAFRTYGTLARPQLYGGELSIESILAGYNQREDGSEIALPLKNAPSNIKNDLVAQGFNANADYYFTYYVDASNDIINTVPQSTTDLTLKYAGLSAEGYKMYMAARERKLKISEELYPSIVNKDNCYLYVGYDDSKPFTTMQTNDGRYIQEQLLGGSDNSIVFSGTDELGMMAVAKLTTDIYGSVDVNVDFFGIGKDLPGDAYDTGTLYKGVMDHITGIGANYSYYHEGDVDVLVLTRTDNYDNVVSPSKANYSDADLEQLRNYAGKLIDRVDANLNAGIPTIVVDCAFKDDYLASMLMQRYCESYHDSDVSGRLNQLLSYSQWNTTANSLGTAISNGVSRYTYLKNCDPKGITEESHMAAYKANVKAWVKDYGYQAGAVEFGQFYRSKPYNGESTFARTYNDFWEITEYITGKLNQSSVATAVDENGMLVIPATNDYRASVSNLSWCWDRDFEGNFDIDVVKSTDYESVNYSDYKVTNLALNKSYTTSWSWDNSKWSASEKSYEDYKNLELTNGVRVYQTESGYGFGDNPYWAGWSFAAAEYMPPNVEYMDENANFFFDITVDLENEYPVYQANIDNLCLGVNSSNEAVSGVYIPGKIQLLTSTDNKNFTLQRTITPDDGTKGVKQFYLGTNGGAVTARYVKLRIWQNHDVSITPWFFASEIEILGLDGTRAEYVNSSGLYFNYKVEDGRTPYILWDGTDSQATAEQIAGTAKPYSYMTPDSGSRLRMYKYSSDSNMYSTYAANLGYTNNLARPKSCFIFTNDSLTSGSRTNLSGWNLKSSGGDELGIYLTIDGKVDYMVSQVAVHVAGKFAGLNTPKYAKLYLVAPDGTETEVTTKNCTTTIFDGDINNDGKWDSATDNLEGFRWILEVADEALKVPYGYKLKVGLGRTNNSGMNEYILAGIQIIGRDGRCYIDDIAEEAATAAYDFTGTNAADAGFAEGTISVKPIASKTSTGNYLIYYTDENGVLAGYDEIASIPITGSKVTYNVPAGIMIPVGATGIAVFESQSAFLANAPDISTAVATVVFPSAKRLSLGQAEAVFGVTSDVDIYDTANNATGKYAAALNFFNEKGAEYVVFTGDITSSSVVNGKGMQDQYNDYAAVVAASPYNDGTIYEAMGDTAANSTTLPMFVESTGKEGSDKLWYFEVVKEGEAGEKNNVYLTTRVTGYGLSSSMADWIEEKVELYDNENNNVFLIIHKPFQQSGVGNKFAGDKSDFIDLTYDTTENKNALNTKVKQLLEDHPNVIVMSGHTHNSFYTGTNYSNDNGTFAHTVHVSSVTSPTADGRQAVGTNYGSEGYIVKCYENYIVYTGYNLSTGKIIPGACIIIPTGAAS